MDLLQLKEKYREFEIEKRNREMVVWKPVVFNVNRDESKVLHNFLDTIKEERNWIILGKVLKNRAKEEKKSLLRYHRFLRCDEKRN